MKIAMLGAGSIAGVLADTMRRMDSVECYAVAARDLSRAEQFQKEFGYQKAYGSYVEMLEDPEVELVYISTLHPFHYEHARLCIDHGKPVLCEKPFTVNAKQAKELLAYAKEKGVFITEAIWTRYMPMRKKIDDALASGIIGEPVTLTANLGYSVAHVERLAAKNLAGGALLDIGVYPLNFALMHFGDDIEAITSNVVYTERGVDKQNTVVLTYLDGRMAVLTSTFAAASDRKGIIWGTEGYMVSENINNCQGARFFGKDHVEILNIVTPKQISGYEYEIDASIKAVSEGELECVEMPHYETIKVMELLDSIRDGWGYSFPMED
ncbi:MAG: Gfo/Idh/MocA family oxidoreductase [Oscillospiraceae bacterium]|nr:Gfo/Idh/MocA family oxidoreductase [Oscillospiraceae bacterium]